MNKKDIKKLRKEIKQDNYKFAINKVNNYYLKKTEKGAKVLFDTETIIAELDDTEQTMYFNNFKKIVSTAIGSKMFDLEFDKNDKKDMLKKTLISEASKENFIKDICDNYIYGTDIIVNISTVDYLNSIPKDKDADKEEKYDKKRMLFVTFNKVELNKKAIKINSEEEELIVDSQLDYIMNLNPIEGIVYPSLSGDNNVMYYIGKPKDLQKKYISQWLGVNFPLTAIEEKDEFTYIINNLCKNININNLINIYKEIISRINLEDEENSLINFKEIKSILERNNVNTTRWDEVLEKGNIKNEPLKIFNLIPEKNFTINSNNAVINISIKDLQNISSKDGELILNLRDNNTADNIPVTL